MIAPMIIQIRRRVFGEREPSRARHPARTPAPPPQNTKIFDAKVNVEGAPDRMRAAPRRKIRRQSAAQHDDGRRINQ